MSFRITIKLEVLKCNLLIHSKFLDIQQHMNLKNVKKKKKRKQQKTKRILSHQCKIVYRRYQMHVVE